MNKKTVEEAIKQGLKIGDEVWVKGEVLKIEEDVVPLCLGLEKKNRYWFKDGDEIYLPTDTAPEWLTLAECEPCVGDVVEIRHKEREEYCIEEFKVLEVSETGLKIADVLWVHLQHDVRCLRVKSRAAQPEQWQPKEGELVWSKGNKIKIKAHYNFNGDVFYTGEKGYIGGGVFELEPYANQDAKIDFSVAGQWVRNDSNFVLITTGETDELAFYGINPKNGARCMFRSDLMNWRLITPEQMR